MSKQNQSFEEISKMNLAELDVPDSVRGEEDEAGTGHSEAAGASTAEDGKPAAEAVNPAEVFPEQEKMDDPTGEHYHIEATIGKPEMTEFVRVHMMRAPGVLGIMALGVILPLYSFAAQRERMWMAFIFMFVLTFVYPIWQYKKIVDQNMKNPVYQNVFHYMVDEKGFHLEAGLRAVNVDWKDFSKKRVLKKSYVFYTGKTNAYIFPKKDLGDSEEQIISFMDRMMRNR